VSDFEGLTRDRQYGEILFDDDSETYVTLIDTGGLTNQEGGLTDIWASNERDDGHDKRCLEVSSNH
jgi:predicted GTPase